jgi:hypothetical protein
MATQPLDITQLSQLFAQLLERHQRRSDMTCGSLTKNLKTYKLDGNNWVEVENEQANREELEQREAKMVSEAETQNEFRDIMRKLCSTYLEMTPNQRAEIRQMVAGRNVAECVELSTWILKYADRVARRINGPNDVQFLREGLAAVSIENCGCDYRDTLTALADLFVGAEEVGIDPRPHFLAVAGLSSTDRTRGGLDSVAETLRQMETYAVIKERRTAGMPYYDYIASTLRQVSRHEEK